MRYLFAGLLVLVSFAAWGQSVTLSWTPPTQFTDGTALDPATHLSGYGVYVNGARHSVAPNTVSSYVVDGLGYGTHEFAVTAIGVNGQESVRSNSVSRTIVDNRVPRPPTLLDVIVAWIKWLFSRFV